MSTTAIIAGIAAAATVASTGYAIYQGMHPPHAPTLPNFTGLDPSKPPQGMLSTQAQLAAKRGAAVGGGGTILTSPIGIPGGAQSTAKTLIGA
jgi:hypothetical protein